MEEYNARLKRITDAIELREPDRVPVAPKIQCWPVLRTGASMKDVLYDFNKGAECMKKFAIEFEPDYIFGHRSIHMGKGPLFERMCSKTTIWAGKPGGGIPDNSIHQFIEYPVLLDEDMDFFQKDYTGWLLEKGLPSVSETLEPFKELKLYKLDILSDQSSLAALLSKPEIRKAIEELWAIHDMSAEIMKDYRKLDDDLEALGFPVLHKGFMSVPFDLYSDFYRGTINSMTDLYDREDLIRSFCKSQLQYMLESVRAQGQSFKDKLVFIPLHKGMDKFMSDDQYRRLYWSDLRTIIEEIITNGMTPYVYTEGPYDSRLEALTEVPKGKVIYHFEQANMANAKKILGNTACISGGFPAYKLQFAKKEEIIDECKRLIDSCAPGGGFIFETSSGFDDAKEENVEALVDTVKEYGKY